MMIRIVLRDNDILKNLFFHFGSFVFSIFSCVSQLMRSLGFFDVKTTFQKKYVYFDFQKIFFSIFPVY